MINVIAFPRKHKPKVPDQPSPADFDPADPPLVGPLCAEIVADLRYHRKVERLHSKGPRVVAEFLAELGADRLIATIIDEMLDRYLALADEALDTTEACDFWPAPIHLTHGATG